MIRDRGYGNYYDSKAYTQFSRLTTDFVIGAGFVAVFNIMQNLSGLGFENISILLDSFFNGNLIDIEALKKAATTDLQRVTLDKLAEFSYKGLWVTTFTITAYSGPFTAFLAKLRTSATSPLSQIEITKLSWFLGVFYSFTGPKMYQVNNVFTNANGIMAGVQENLSAVVIAGTMTITGLTFLFGNGEAYIRTIKRLTIRAQESSYKLLNQWGHLDTLMTNIEYNKSILKAYVERFTKPVKDFTELIKFHTRRNKFAIKFKFIELTTLKENIKPTMQKRIAKSFYSQTKRKYKNRKPAISCKLVLSGL